MPPPIRVELVPHSDEWSAAARAEAERLRDGLGGGGGGGAGWLVAVHHVGSTAVPGICAKPILDLLPEVRSLAELDAARAAVEALGYAWWGEFGIRGRRYCTLDDAATGRRRVQLHCFATGHPEVAAMLAFRDYLRAHPGKAAEYEAAKRGAAAEHGDDSHAYTDAKAPWIAAQLGPAMAYSRSRAP